MNNCFISFYFLFCLISFLCSEAYAESNPARGIDEEKVAIIKSIAKEWVSRDKDVSKTLSSLKKTVDKMTGLEIDSQFIEAAIYNAYLKTQTDIEKVLIVEMYGNFSKEELNVILKFESSEAGHKFRKFSEEFGENQDMDRIYENIVEHFLNELGPTIDELHKQKLKKTFIKS